MDTHSFTSNPNRTIVIILVIVIVAAALFNLLYLKTDISQFLTGFFRKAPREAPEVIRPFQIPEEIEYAPEEIIVKFKPRVGIKAKDVWQKGQKFRTITGNDSLDNLISKYQVKEMKRVFQGLETIMEKEGINETEAFKRIKAKFPLVKEPKIYNLSNIYLLKLKKDANIMQAIQEFYQDPDVEYAEPNFIVYALATPNDPHYSKLWGLNNTGQTGGTPDADIDAPEVWDIQIGSPSVVIGVIDTGVDYNHEDLAVNMWTNPKEIPGNGIDDDGNGYIDDYRGWDFYNNDNDPFDDYGHGTHCAGTIGAVGNNGIGVPGVNWQVKILPIKFLSSGGSGTTLGAIQSVEYATLMGVTLTSNSWGGGGYSQTLKNAISSAGELGILFVAAAGNSSKDIDAFPMYPAAYDNPNIIAVAATDHNDNLASFSNYGANSVDLGAPGVNIYSTVPKGTCALCIAFGYRYLSGTSMATPHVAGVAGLVKAQFPTLTGEALKLRVFLADSIPSLDGKVLTGGRLNAFNSLEIDETPPSAVIDLTTGKPTINSITLTWTASGDDGLIGKANSYDIRYSTSLITEANFGQATKVVGEPKPQSQGSTETFRVTGLSYSTTYYFALKVLDNVGNSSGLSNVTSETTKTPTIIFKDDMESGINGWAAESLWHQETLRSKSPTTSWAYNTGSPDYNYNTDQRNYGKLTSPVIDLSGYSSAVLTFQYLYNTETSGTSWDQRWVEIWVDGVINKAVQLSGDPMMVWNQYSWDISSYVGKSNIQIKFRFDTIDSVYNNYEGWYIDDVIIMGEPNNPPVADDQSVTTNEDTAVAITLTATDPDGNPLTYSLVTLPVNGSLSGTAPNLTYTPNLNFNGLASFTFKANDGKVDSNIATVSITVNPVNDPPIANAGPDQAGFVGDVIVFDGSASYDPDGTIISYNWNFGDGTTDSGVKVEHIYSKTSTYTVTLTVTDNGGLTANDTASVTVAAKDIVTITKAFYFTTRQRLNVEATSTASPQAQLTVVGFGLMTYYPEANAYRFIKEGVKNPGTVTVISSKGGSVTKVVEVKGK